MEETSKPHCFFLLRNLRITTDIQLHPEFSADPLVFAQRHGVDLAGVVFPVTNFKKDPDDQDGNKRIEVTKSNIHLDLHGSIRLFAERNQAGDSVMSIELNPAELLDGVAVGPLCAGDLTLSLSILKAKVAPLLANPTDAQHIVPGLAQDQNPVAYWSMIDSEILLPGLEAPCLNDLDHPLTGPPEGATLTRIQFGDKKDDCLIRIKEFKVASAGSNGQTSFNGLRVRLILKGQKLITEFKPFGTMAPIGDIWRLTAFSEPGIARVHQAVMARMEGTYLPVPTEWRNQPKDNITHAKAMALVSRLTSIPLERLQAIDVDVRNPSKSTRKRLKKDIHREYGRLGPVPVATIFTPSAYTIAPSPGTEHNTPIDPQIAQLYGTT